MAPFGNCLLSKTWEFQLWELGQGCQPSPGLDGSGGLAELLRESTLDKRRHQVLFVLQTPSSGLGMGQFTPQLFPSPTTSHYAKSILQMLR